MTTVDINTFNGVSNYMMVGVMLLLVANTILLLFNIESTRKAFQKSMGGVVSTTSARLMMVTNIVVFIAMAYLYWRSARCNMQCNTEEE